MAVLWLYLCAAIFGIGHAASVGGKSASYDTIVVGLGAAGTAAASALTQAGRRVLALEAQGRVGGRVNTLTCGDGVVELGAEWIHGTDGSPTYKLGLENNVTMMVQDYNLETYWSDRRRAYEGLLGELVELTLTAMDGDPPEQPESLGDFMSKKITAYISEHYPQLVNDTEFLTGFLSFADLIVDGYTGSDTWFDTSTQTTYETLGGSQDMSWNVNGYKTLFEILLNTYKGGSGLPNLTIKLNTEVTQIVWPQDPTAKVVVKTKDGGDYTADNVIVTVSVGVLKAKHSTLFSPALPPKKTNAIENIPLGVVNKIVLVFPERWWAKNEAFGFLWKAADKAQVSDEDFWTTKIAAVSAPMGCENALTMWTNGEVARHIETLPEDVITAKSIELLTKFLGHKYNITEPTTTFRSTWYSNPFTRGSYSYDSLTAPQHPTVRNDLAEPLTDSSGEPRVLFAGEASHHTQYSTVHGAVSSGQREAARLLNEEVSVTPGLKGRGRRRGGAKKTSEQ